jgi:RimJ/RimL family protein N-acetyltransferase
MWIVEHDGAPVGVVRLDPGADVTWISIALAPEARGRGIGRRAIRAACEAHAQPIYASIRVHNTTSRGAFEACGFVLCSVTEALVTYRWSP